MTYCPPPQRSVSPWWRALSVALSLLLLVGGAAGWSLYEQSAAQIRHLHQQLTQQTTTRHVAVLLDDQQRPAILVSEEFPAGTLHVQRLNAVVEGREDSMQLWALQEGAAPRSLGVLTPKLKTLQLPAMPDSLTSINRLAISVEDRGGVAEARGPRLPYLFQGAWVLKAL